MACSDCRWHVGWQIPFNWQTKTQKKKSRYMYFSSTFITYRPRIAKWAATQQYEQVIGEDSGNTCNGNCRGGNTIICMPIKAGGWWHCDILIMHCHWSESRLDLCVVDSSGYKSGMHVHERVGLEVITLTPVFETEMWKSTRCSIEEDNANKTKILVTRYSSSCIKAWPGTCDGLGWK